MDAGWVLPPLVRLSVLVKKPELRSLVIGLIPEALEAEDLVEPEDAPISEVVAVMLAVVTTVRAF